MADGRTIEQAYVATYESNVRQLAQQGVTKLLPIVQIKHSESESHNWETLDEQDTNIGLSSVPGEDGISLGMHKRTSVDCYGFPADTSGAIPGGYPSDLKPDVEWPDGIARTRLADIDTPASGYAMDTWQGPTPTPMSVEVWQKRRTIISTYDCGNSTEIEDPRQMLIDPNSAITVSQGMKMKRAVDDIIITKAFSPALNKCGTRTVFPDTDQTVGGTGTFGDAGTPKFSFDLLTAITEKFLMNDIDPMEQKWLVISPTIARKLMQITEATNFDYANAKVLADGGIIQSWMGYTWIISTRLEHNTAAGGTPGSEVFAIALTKRALGLHIANDIKSKVGESVDRSFAWILYSYMSMDLVRVEDKHIVKVHVQDVM